MAVQRPGKSCLMMARKHMVNWALQKKENNMWRHYHVVGTIQRAFNGWNRLRSKLLEKGKSCPEWAGVCTCACTVWTLDSGWYPPRSDLWSAAGRSHGCWRERQPPRQMVPCPASTDSPCSSGRLQLHTPRQSDHHHTGHIANVVSHCSFIYVLLQITKTPFKTLVCWYLIFS